MAHQDSPKFIDPRHIGLTLTEAVGLRTRYLASNDLGGGAELDAILGFDGRCFFLKYLGDFDFAFQIGLDMMDSYVSGFNKKGQRDALNLVRNALCTSQTP